MLKRQFDTSYREGETVPRVMATRCTRSSPASPIDRRADAARHPARMTAWVRHRLEIVQHYLSQQTIRTSGNPTQAVLYNAGKAG